MSSKPVKNGRKNVKMPPNRDLVWYPSPFFVLGDHFWLKIENVGEFTQTYPIMNPKLGIKLVTSGIFRNIAETKPVEVPIFQGIFQNSKPRRALYILLDILE